MRVLSSILLGAALIGAGAAASAARPDNARAEARLAKALDGRIAGKPVSCITLRDIDSTEIIDGTGILYRTTGKMLYLNRPRAGQEWLDSDDILVSKSWGSQLCNLDTIRLLDRSTYFERGSVGLGDFVPYTKAPKD